MAPPGITSSMESRLGDGDTTSDTSQRNIVVLDGGFATQLSCHVQQPIDGDVLWSARFLATDQEAVIDTHLDFLRAGADLIMTNTYQASEDLFVKHLKLTEEQSYDLIKQSVDLARTAVKRYEEEFPGARKPLIVGSVGPYGASLHDGSEYTGSYAKTTSVTTIREWHIPRIRALVEAGVDLLALETIPCKVEAETLVTLLKEQFPNTRAWLTFSVGVSTYRDNWFVKVVSIPGGTVFLNACWAHTRAQVPDRASSNRGRSVPFIIFKSTRGQVY